MLGYLRNRAVLDEHGVTLWSEVAAGEWKASAAELAGDLETLAVPHVVTVTGRRQPPWRSANTRLPRSQWVKLWILWSDVPALARWFPSLGRAVDGYDGPETLPTMGTGRVAGEPALLLNGERVLGVWPASPDHAQVPGVSTTR